MAYHIDNLQSHVGGTACFSSLSGAVSDRQSHVLLEGATLRYQREQQESDGR